MSKYHFLRLAFAGCVHLMAVFAVSHIGLAANVELGPRPYFLVEQMKDGPLKEKLRSCAGKQFKSSRFSIGHRGAPLQFPEHTEESYRAAARMGAGVLECDVTFTKDKELVCRHAQNDLHTSTNILATPLADKCSKPFTPAKDGNPASADCRTSDITLDEFKLLSGKMDGANTQALEVESYLNGTAAWRTDLYAMQAGKVMSHAESINLFEELGVKFMPELKVPIEEMPFDRFSRQEYAQKMIDEYKAAGISSGDVWPQSFSLEDVRYWIKEEPEFGRQAVYLDSSFRRSDFDHTDPATFQPSMTDLKAMGVNYIAPPIWMLLTLNDSRIVPSAYAIEAKMAGLKIIAWSLERSGSLNAGGGWYFKSIAEAVENDGALYEVLDVLVRNVGVAGVFSDWPATVTYYANCMDIEPGPLP